MPEPTLPRPSRPPLARRRKALFAALVAGAVLLALEGLARLHVAARTRGADADTAILQADRLRVYFDWDARTIFHEPDQEFVDRTKPIAPYPVRINGHGFRGADVETAPGPDHLRVLVLGDSNVYGPGVPDDATMPAVLERELARALPARRVEVLNAGVSGSTISDEWILLERKGLPLAPDAVVLAYCNNDIGDLVDRAFRDRQQAEVWRFTRAQGLVPRLLDGSTLYRLGVSVFANWRADRLRRDLPAWFSDGGHSADLIPVGRYPDAERAIETYEGYLRRFGELARARDLPFVFLAVPDGVAEDPRKARKLYERFYAVARDAGLAVADPWPLYLAEAEPADVFDPVHTHPNAHGLALLAEPVAAALLDDPRVTRAPVSSQDRTGSGDGEGERRPDAVADTVPSAADAPDPAAGRSP